MLKVWVGLFSVKFFAFTGPFYHPSFSCALIIAISVLSRTPLYSPRLSFQKLFHYLCHFLVFITDHKEEIQSIRFHPFLSIIANVQKRLRLKHLDISNIQLHHKIQSIHLKPIILRPYIFVRTKTYCPYTMYFYLHVAFSCVAH